MEQWEIDLRTARDESIADPSSLTPLAQLSWWWKHCVHYEYEGRDHQIVSVQRVRQRGYGACGDAAAHLLAAAKRQGLRAQLCVQEFIAAPGSDEESYRHVRVFLPGDNVTLDPYAQLRPPEFSTDACERMLTL